ncbi:MAG TPA: MFS transporter [Steroidobacteraceae bacterium]|nr:MFS transporter [Steroidobacteraceae bacterium]
MHLVTREPASQPALTRGITFACALACGAIVANLYYAQPLVGLVAPDLGLSPGAAGSVVTVAQLGYAAGLMLVVPLADRLENRVLTCSTILLQAAALAALAFSSSSSIFFVAAFAIGFFSASAQVLMPLAAALTPEAQRGRTVGNVMAGLLTGIMLSRPLASLATAVAGWRAIFFCSAVWMVGLAIFLSLALPQRFPSQRQSYGAMLRTMGSILVRERMVQRRAVYHGVVLAIFNIFWTASPLLLHDKFGYGQSGIALFALAGAAGAAVAPLAGRLGDKGYIRLGTAGAMLTVTLASLAAGWAGAIGSLALLVVFALALDAATQVNQVLGFRVIFTLPGEDKGRVNAVYMTIIFVLGALGSSVATWSYHVGGWWGAMCAGAVAGGGILLVFASEHFDIAARAHYERPGQTPRRTGI